MPRLFRSRSNPTEGESMPARKPTTKSARKPAKKMPAPRVSLLSENELGPEQRALLASIRSGPRGGSTGIRGPFAVFLHAPAFGELAQQLGGHCRFKTAVPPRLSELAVLLTAKFWRAQYEWYAHVPLAERAGVKKETINDIYRGRAPKSAPRDERAIYDFVQELYKTRRVSDRNFARVQAVLGDAATVELVGILGYYVLISMILDVFRMPLPEGERLPFAELGA
jgi:4-carboxymuconolactone decarboxylase